MSEGLLQAASLERLLKHNSERSLNALPKHGTKKRQQKKTAPLSDLAHRLPFGTEEQNLAAKVVENALLINRHAKSSQKASRKLKAGLSFHTSEDDMEAITRTRSAIKRFAELAKPSSEKSIFGEDMPSISEQRKKYKMPSIVPKIPDAILKSGVVIKLK
jgi:hypothetical protein